MGLKICGLPGYGSAGKDGERGKRGSNIHYISDSIYDNEIQEYILNEYKYKTDDLFYHNNKMYLIDLKDGNKSSYKLLSENISSDVLSVVNNNIIFNENTVLSDKLKTVNYLKTIDNNSYLNLCSVGDKKYLNINVNNSDILNIKYVNDVSTFIINDLDVETKIADLYVKYDNYKNGNIILNESFGFSELNNIINNCKIENETLKIDYTPKFGKYRITNREYKDNKLVKETIIKDYNDSEIKSNITITDSIYRFYFLSNYDDSVGYMIFGDYTLDKKMSKLVKVICESGHNFQYQIGGKDIKVSNIISEELKNIPIKFILEFTEDSDLTVYSADEHINYSIDNDNKKVIIEFDIPTSLVNYKINIGRVVYTFIYEPLKKYTFDTSTVFKFEDDSNGYLGNTNYTNGVPVNGILQSYNLNFYSCYLTEDPNLNFKITCNNATNIYRIYYKVVKPEEIVKDSSLILVDKNRISNVRLSDLNDADYIEPENDLIEFNIDVSLDLNKIETYISNDSSSYKLLLYFEFNDPKYGMLNTNISCKFNDIQNAIISKRTLVIPWKISAFKPTNITSSSSYDLRAICEVKRDEGICPKNLQTLTISPMVNNSEYGLKTLDRYNYKINSKTSSTVYAPSAFLMFGYTYPNKTEAKTFIVNDDNLRYTGKSHEYSQIELKYPIWTIVSPVINVLDNKFVYECPIFAPAGSKYAPGNNNGIIVDENFTSSYKNNFNNYLINNKFLGFVGWSLQQTEKNYSINKYKTKKFNFSLIDENNEENYTMYGSYWNIYPRFVKADTVEPTFDYAVNILKIPEVFISNKYTERYWCNSNNPNSLIVYNMNEYTVTSSITDLSTTNSSGTGGGGSRFNEDLLLEDSSNNGPSTFEHIFSNSIIK